jgi:uncharacterized protein YerC
MPKVSKERLPQQDETSLFIQLTRLFSNKSDIETQGILSDLLGYEEKLMLAKRFAVIVMLWKKQSLYSISKKLHVSTSTVARIQDNYKQGLYASIIEALDTSGPSVMQILKTIDGILHLGGILPHYGETHASELYKRDREARRQRQK